MGDSTPNKELLRRVAQRLGSQPFVTQVNPFPSHKPATVEVVFDETAYPDQVSRVYVDLEVERSGNFYIHYVEQWDGHQKECRWDRHENPHNDRDHYHPLHDASTKDAVDRAYPADFGAVVGEVLAEIQSRWGETFDEV
ncbi:hypothetical protein SAMN04487950_3301 [Halogranum rubrum]|uniref:Uncharacterized protein n=1 Tax=Halogranum rubrum TaxID=553466 RepID=A0A1I4GNN4_9EURY|nr:hypothetical protein [Halogranum rubrum]SFL31595.1 hypothetical protein SAMN04487950_3301 [Halogranum rubrum]